MHILGYIASVLIGVSLGLIGGGGSILTVPVLVYLFGVSPVLATSYSLFIVGSTSLAGAITNYRKGLVSLPTALLFGVSSILTVFLTRKFLIPAIPKHIATIGHYNITKDVATMVLFALLMLLASFSMIRSEKNEDATAGEGAPEPFYKLLFYGIGIGLVTGLLGAGGGFLLIPALVLFVHLPMKKAVGTSLLIIALNSLIGFTGDIGHQPIDWWFMVTISLIAIAGILIGSYLNKKIAGESLKKGFGWFVLLMSVYILVKELFFTSSAG